MQSRSRRLFFWFLFGLFWVTAGIILLYALGYRYSLERGIFIYTGSITLKTNPETVTILVDEQPADSQASLINSSYLIGGLKPGVHSLTVSAPDFRPWQKEVIVSSGLSTEFWNIILPRRDYPATGYPLSYICKSYLAPDHTLLALLAQENGETTVTVLDTNANTLTQVFSTRQYQLLPEDAKENIEWSPQSDGLIIPLLQGEKLVYFFVDVDTLEATQLGDVINQTPLEKVRWHPTRRNSLLYLVQGELWSLHLDAPADRERLAEHIESYDISGGRIYFFETPTGLVLSFPLSNPERLTQITTDSPADMTDSRYATIVYDEERLALINYTTGDLYAYNRLEPEQASFDKLSDSAAGAQFSDDGKKLLYWTDWEIMVRFLRDWEVQPVRSANTLSEIGRFSGGISQVQWTEDYEHVLFATGEEIKMIELDHRGERRTETLVSLSAPPRHITSDFADNLVYFVASPGPDQPATLSSFIFPEPTGFLGLGG